MENVPIAIVGVSCRFAGAPDVDAFWRLVMERRSAITPLDGDVALAFGAANLFNRPYPAAAGQLGRLYACVAREQTFPRQLNAGENQDLYFATQLAFNALADAGMRPHPASPVRGSVRLGYAPPFSMSSVNWLEHTFFIDQTIEVIRRLNPHAPETRIDEMRRALVGSLPAPDAESFLSGAGHRIAGWIAHEAAFSGGASTLDAGVLSGVAALRTAVDDLRSGRADVVLAGALEPPLSRAFLEGVSGTVTFSQATSLVPFSRDASGTVPGEGGVFFVLKRRADALAARDHIYALVRDIACGSLPRADVLAAAADVAGVPITSIRMIEADGSGIPEADAEEIEIVQKLWGEHVPGGPLVGIGSVKGNIGHTFRAAAAASLLKAALSLHSRVLAPQVACERPPESLANLKSSAYLLDSARPWITGDATSPRRAAVLAGDFTGRRAAVILEEEHEPEERK